jgi:hypothetical protein
MGSGGKGPSVDYTQSPQQQQMYQMFMQSLGPMFGYEYTPGQEASADYRPGSMGSQQGYGRLGVDNPQQQWTPGQGTAATEGSWGYTGAPWQPPIGLSPTADWYSNLSPDVMAGLQQPYIDAQRQGLELLGAGGAAGSARGGASGTAGAMTGEIMGQMAQNVPMQAWQMGADQRQALMMPYQAATGMMGATMPEAVVSQQSGVLDYAIPGLMTAGMLGWNPFAAAGAGAGMGMFGMT